jgi:hypothetical protein
VETGKTLVAKVVGNAKMHISTKNGTMCNNSENCNPLPMNLKYQILGQDKTFYLLLYVCMYFLLYVFYDFMRVIICGAMVS